MLKLVSHELKAPLNGLAGYTRTVGLSIRFRYQLPPGVGCVEVGGSTKGDTNRDMV